ncbi:MAG: proton-conducting transporter membrane subunit [archaeon]|nr:proton-conducting transporter membrane subunit [archaeon]
MVYFHLVIPFILIVVFLITIINGRHKEFYWRLATGGVVMSTIFLLLDLPSIIFQKTLVHYMLGWRPPFGISLALDQFNYVIAVLVMITAAASLIIGKAEIQKNKKIFYALFMLLLLGLYGCAVTGDIFNLFVFFEILSIAAYGLTSYANSRDSAAISIKYLIMGSFTTSLILLGIALVYGSLGTLNMADIAEKISQSSTVATQIGLAFLLCGFSFKAAVAPFHAWKPSVIKTTPLCAGLMFTAGGTVIGLYTIFRLIATIGTINISGLLVFLSIITMAFGAALALNTDNLKKMLAYSAISQTGYVLMGFGLGTYTGALYHMVNLVIIDILLFVTAYVVINHFKTNSLSKMGGLGFNNPVLFVCCGIGVFALCGLPFFNGFSSKVLIYMAGLVVFPLATFAAMVVSVLTLAYSFKMFNMIFLSNRKNYRKIEMGLGLKWMVIIFAAFCVFFGVFQSTMTELMASIAGSGLDREFYIRTVLGIA